jgi:putative endonuclease
VAAKALKAALQALRPWRSGASGEDLACQHLRRKGYTILARNFRCRSGEIDVVARDGPTVVFVEVKERKGSSHGAGHEGVTFGKRRRVIRAARLFVSSRGYGEAQPFRFDVVSIDWREGEPVVRHDPGAFDVDGS